MADEIQSIPADGDIHVEPEPLWPPPGIRNVALRVAAPCPECQAPSPMEYGVFKRDGSGTGFYICDTHGAFPHPTEVRFT